MRCGENANLFYRALATSSRSGDASSDGRRELRSYERRLAWCHETGTAHLDGQGGPHAVPGLGWPAIGRERGHGTTCEEDIRAGGGRRLRASCGRLRYALGTVSCHDRAARRDRPWRNSTRRRCRRSGNPTRSPSWRRSMPCVATLTGASAACPTCSFSMLLPRFRRGFNDAHRALRSQVACRGSTHGEGRGRAARGVRSFARAVYRQRQGGNGLQSWLDRAASLHTADPARHDRRFDGRVQARAHRCSDRPNVAAAIA